MYKCDECDHTLWDAQKNQFIRRAPRGHDQPHMRDVEKYTMRLCTCFLATPAWKCCRCVRGINTFAFCTGYVRVLLLVSAEAHLPIQVLWTMQLM